MSKRSEAAALEAYPPTYSTLKRNAKRVQSERVDTRQPARAIFQQGYEQAETDMIERACDILTNYVFEDVTPKMIDHFRKRLEKEYGRNHPKQEQPEVDLKMIVRIDR